MSFTDIPEGFRSGFVSFVGRPNTGKSTLTNALVGEKIAITADQPETTRHPIRGLVHRDDAQIIVVDTPGLHRPRTLLGERLNESVKETYSDVDLIGLTIPAHEKIGPGDRWILDAVRTAVPKTPIVGIITKIDKASRDQIAAQLMAVHELLGGTSEVVPVSSTTGENVDTLSTVIAGLLPTSDQRQCHDSCHYYCENFCFFHFLVLLFFKLRCLTDTGGICFGIGYC